MQLVNRMQLGHSSSSYKDKSIRTHRNTHLRYDYDALCCKDGPDCTKVNKWLFCFSSVDGGVVFKFIFRVDRPQPLVGLCGSRIVVVNGGLKTMMIN